MIDTKISIAVNYEFIGETNVEWNAFQEHVQKALGEFVLHTLPTTYTKVGSVCMCPELPTIWTNIWLRFDKDNCRVNVICVDFKVEANSETPTAL
jgi:hypothetical protein